MSENWFLLRVGRLHLSMIMHAGTGTSAIPTTATTTTTNTRTMINDYPDPISFHDIVLKLSLIRNPNHTVERTLNPILTLILAHNFEF